MDKDRKARIDLIFIFALFLNAFFEFKFVIDLSNENQQHLYNFYLYEVLAVLVFLNFIYNYQKKIKNNKPIIFLFVTLCCFSCYYIILSFVRLITHNNYSSSMSLFRLFFCACTFMIYVMLNPSKKKLLINVIKIFLLTLNIGYLIISIKEKYLAPRFPDFSSDYLTVALLSIPLCVWFLEEDKGNPILVGINFTNLGIMCISGCFSGSRAGFAIWCIEIITLFIAAVLKRQKSICIGLIAVIVGLTVLYFCNFNFCQASINRVLHFGNYQVNMGQNIDTEQDVMSDYSSMEDNSIDVNEDLTINMDVNYHNPAVLSNKVRKVLWVEAINLLRNDWLFSLKGNTELKFVMDGKPEISGAHNFLLDYTLAFGTVGVLFAAVYFGAAFIFTLNRILKSGKRNMLIVYLLILFAMGGMGLTQAVCSTKLPLIIFCIYMALIFIDKEENCV